MISFKKDLLRPAYSQWVMTTVYSLRYLRSVSYHAAQLLVLARRLYVCVCIICVCTFVFDVRVYMYMCLCFFAIPRFGEIK